MKFRNEKLLQDPVCCHGKFTLHLYTFEIHNTNFIVGNYKTTKKRHITIYLMSFFSLFFLFQHP